MEKKSFNVEEQQLTGTNGTDGVTPPLGEVILDFLGVITKWRRFIVWFILISTILTTLVTLVLPKWYKATASVFPAEQADLFAGLQGMSSLVKSIGVGGRLSSLGQPSETERYMAILKSDNALTKVIDKFKLTEVYDITSYPHEKTVKELLSNIDFEIADEGNLEVSVYDKDPHRSAEMANYFVDILNEINAQLHAQDARGNREFIEQRYQKNTEDLRKAEDALRGHQEKSGTMIVPEQSMSSVSSVADLYGTKAKKEVEIAILQRTVTQDNPTLQQLKIELSELNKKISSFPLNAVASIRLYRDVAIQQKILEFILPLYEQAKVEEKRSTPSVVVLDRAIVPERKARPKISLFALLAFVISSLISMIVVFAGEGLERMKTLDPQRYNRIASAIKSDWFGLKDTPWKKRG